nr:PREDICTED: ATP-dependent DNA helicase Q4 [Latimeria chalumnae]|eukprot:XP_014354024.1 PREDICTED: ATP-dependent DNA helicase Q4 [Latimeria chalumnae]
MDRYNELKVSLKNWEASFLQKHKRKPNKADVENASEETQNLYREYRTLKQERERENGESKNNSASKSKPRKQTEEILEKEKASGCDFWGSHLNKGNSSSPQLTPKDRDELKASAQYFGMKMKCNLGAAIKERPTSLRKFLTPRKTPTPKFSEKIPNTANREDFLPFRPPLTTTSSSTCALNAEPDEPFLPFTPSKPFIGQPKPLGSAGKFQQLRRTVSQRLSSLDAGWLDRCEGSGKPALASFSSPASSSPSQANDAFPPAKGQLPVSGCSTTIAKITSCPPSSISASADEKSIPVTDTYSMSNQKLQQPCDPSSRASEEQALVGDVPAKQREVGEEFKAQRMSEIKRERSVLREATLQSGASEAANHPLDEANGIFRKEGLPADGDVLSDVEQERAEAKKAKGKPESRRAKSRKRLHEASQNEGATEERGEGRGAKSSGLEEGSSKRRRRTNQHCAEGSIAPRGGKKPPRLCGKSKAGKHEEKEGESDASGTESKVEKSEMLDENLFGDIESEGKSTGRRQISGVRAPPKKDGNYVRINLKKKSHVKGCAFKGARLRKQVWKQKWRMKGERFGGGGNGKFNRSSDTCFKCGGTGHWAQDCRGRGPAMACNPPPEEQTERDSSAAGETCPLPTLEEVARLTSSLRSGASVPALMESGDSSREEPVKMAEEEVMLNVVRPVYEPPTPPPPMEPLYALGEDGKVRETPGEVYEALSELGYSSFRSGQELAIMRILSGLSTLAVLSTGMGKSLCYQLPAYMYAKRSKCITLVVSPLVSLMDDQVSGLPTRLKAVCIHSNMTRNQREAAIVKVKEGKAHVLLLSPEALVGGGQSGSACLPPADQLPPVAFACIDEAHCVSEWSHNFRPCYLRLCKVLRERLGVRCMLGLTATATLSTAQDVALHLRIREDDGIAVRSAAVPPNLHLSVSMDRDRDQALVGLLRGEKFGALDSVIVYCTRREETTRIAAMLRTCLQGVLVKETSKSLKAEDDDTAAKRKKAEARKKIRRPLKWIADSYHAGMSAAERRRVQNNFMCGELRIVVATVAFGMGLDKSDVRGIIHYNMPKSFESYVQEIGRAGRDGKPAHCHLFLDPEGGDLNELRRHIYADTVDYFTVKKLIQKVFPPCKCREIQLKQEELLQLPGIETLLCYLELHPQHWVEMLHPTLSTCRIVCYSGPQQLRITAKRCPPVAVALARERLTGIDHTHASSVEFDVVELADSMGWELIPVKRGLRQLQWITQGQSGSQGTRKSGVMVEFSNLSFHFRCYRDLTPQELDSVCHFLHQRVLIQEKTGLCQLQACFRAFHSVAFRNYSSCSEEVHTGRSSRLKELLRDYFDKKVERDQSGMPVDKEEEEEEEDLNKMKLRDWEDQIRSDVRHFLSIHQDEKFSGRAVARIFHGIGSPCYPAQVYGRDRRYWRRYINFDFNELIRIATEEIIRMK